MKVKPKAAQPAADPINPDHYKAGGIEVADVIEAFDLSWNKGSVLKYLLRAGRKDPAKTVEDLEKCRWHIDREIAQLEAK